MLPFVHHREVPFGVVLFCVHLPRHQLFTSRTYRVSLLCPADINLEDTTRYNFGLLRLRVRDQVKKMFCHKKFSFLIAHLASQVLLHRSHRLNMLGANYRAEDSGAYRHRVLERRLRVACHFRATSELRSESIIIHV